jgi:hypothetical protein
MCLGGGMNTMANDSLSSRSVAFLPSVLLIFIHVFVTPLREIFKIEPLLMIPYYAVGIGIGYFIYRKSFLVKDYEYRRSKVMNKMKKVYQAEEAGVWQTNVEVDSELSEEGLAKLSQNIGEINTESPEMVVGEDEKVEVQFLNEASYVLEATRRVSGESTFEEQAIDSTIGSTRKSSPMDNLLDWIGGLFGKRNIGERREEKRISALTAAANAAPVSVSRPNSPLQTTRRDVDSTLKATSMTDEGETEVSLDGRFTSSSEASTGQKPASYSMDKEAYSWDKEIQPTNSQSIESMAMLPGIQSLPVQQLASTVSTQKTCRGCGAVTPPNERFCLNCGLDILP